jgi:SM-20-related protein
LVTQLEERALITSHSTRDELFFSLIAQDIETKGYSIQAGALPDALANALLNYQQTMAAEKFKRAGVGRGQEYLKNKSVRTDQICWITGESAVGRNWLGWSSSLQDFLNQTLFLGLFSFESHFAHYGVGDYYKRHYDAFRGQKNRVLSVVAYLNPGWTHADGGELVLYQNDDDNAGVKVMPLLGTVVAFLSEDFPHEVLPAHRDRYSIAGWFRVNTC